MSEGSEKAGPYVTFNLISERTSITLRVFPLAKWAKNAAVSAQPQEKRLRDSSFLSAEGLRRGLGSDL